MFNLENLNGSLRYNEVIGIISTMDCYDLKSLKWDKRTNSYIRVNTRELDRELFTK